MQLLARDAKPPGCLTLVPPAATLQFLKRHVGESAVRRPHSPLALDSCGDRSLSLMYSPSARTTARSRGRTSRPTKMTDGSWSPTPCAWDCMPITSMPRCGAGTTWSDSPTADAQIFYTPRKPSRLPSPENSPASLHSRSGRTWLPVDDGALPVGHPAPGGTRRSDLDDAQQSARWKLRRR